jgi:hydroxymethylbilane synthase
VRLRISARKSDLARLQAFQVGKALLSKNPELQIQYNFRESLGDKNQTDPLWRMPEKGVFTEDFVQDLLEEKTDLVVHSWKDLPTSLREGTVIAATLPRADQRDLLLFKNSSRHRVGERSEFHVYSSSPRRAYNLEGFLKEHLPFRLDKVQFHNVRGNIQTRVRKLMEDPDVDGLVLAKAALDRLLSADAPEFHETKVFLRAVLQQVRWMVLPLSLNPNASAQGALAIEMKRGRPEIQNLLSSVHCAETFSCVEEERAVLASHGGGCHQKIGVTVLSRPYGRVFFLRGLTDAGKVLNERRILKSPLPGASSAAEVSRKDVRKESANEKFGAEELASSRELQVTREPIADLAWPKDLGALWIAKAEALPEALPEAVSAAEFTADKLVWTAGLQTWRKLAARGVWVHGSAEGLGEEENPRLEILQDGAIHWTKLTHADVSPQAASASTCSGTPMTILPTYRVRVSTDAWTAAEAAGTGPTQKAAFFWHSGSQFLAALAKWPELRQRKHACGPGSTYKVLREKLGNAGAIDIFLDEAEWRKSCSHP